jgi:hypothetical protein
MAEQQMERGAMPHLRALLASAAWGPLRAEPERVPAIVWTTVATGRGPEAHGIQAAGARRLTGLRTPVSLDAERSPFASALARTAELLRLSRVQPASAVLRSAKTFWNVASEKGLRVGVVNWWATWPADPVNGYVVSDRAVFKVERGEPDDRDVHPPSSFAVLRGLARADEPDRPRRIDRFVLAASAALRAADPPDLEALYLPGLDILTVQQLGDLPSGDVAGLESRLDAVRAHYAFLDERLGELLAARAADEVLVLVADPGRLARPGAAAEGLLALVGAPVRPTSLGTVSARDVAPTVLHLAGLPASRELSGHALEAALEPAFRAAHPVRQVAAYGRRPVRPPAESAFDAQILDELRALGYVQ